MSSEIRIKNSDGDFFMAQNYTLQLLAEKKITQSAFVLYSFYRSLAGFQEIRCGYSFISLNSGLAKGSITNANKILQKLGLVRITKNGPNRPFNIEIVPGSELPRRQLKSVDYEARESRSIDEQVVQNMNAETLQCSESERINIDNKYSSNKDNTTAALAQVKGKKNKKINFPTVQHVLLADKFMDYWCSYYNTKVYPKEDLEKLKLIQDPLDAIKYISVLWSLDETDKWIRSSDHSVTIFVKEYLEGRLQSYYPQTRAYMEDKHKERAKGG